MTSLYALLQFLAFLTAEISEKLCLWPKGCVDIDAETEQVVGIELIRFKGRFCQQYPELRQAWETVQQAERRVLESFSSLAV